MVSVGENSVFHNRLTHSLKVAQTARLICDDLLARASSERVLRGYISAFGGLHPSVLAAACLAHDIGHPPFGHIGEKAIQDVLADPRRFLKGYSKRKARAVPGNFEGNAQSFRIVTRLAFRQQYSSVPSPALNLTRATLSAQSKYPWASDSPEALEKKKWGAYASEAGILQWAMEGIEAREIEAHGVARVEARTIEAQIMDWADDVAYAVHDIEDFFRAGLVPLDKLSSGTGEFDDFMRYAFPRVEDRFRNYDIDSAADLLQNSVLGEFPSAPYIGSQADRIRLHGFASTVIASATRGLSVTKEGVLLPDDKIFVIIEILKQLTWFYVIDQPALSSAQRGQRNTLVSLIDLLWQWSYVHMQEQARRGFGVDEEGIRTTEQLELSYRELPPRLVDYINISCSPMLNDKYSTLPEKVLRGVVDYVASLTDAQAIRLFSRLAGADSQSMLENLLFL